MTSLPVLKCLLVANRGEIAVRILSAARELGISTIAIYTVDDTGHAFYADAAVALSSQADFMDAKKIVSICKQQGADSLHPGYGFLSENPDLVDLLSEAGIAFIGPTADILRVTSDKTHARALAQQNYVPILPASPHALHSVKDAETFISSVGFPIMIKAVDGGGGRGIRLVERAQDLESSFARACAESPSQSVFIEKAAIYGFRHVEVQILGDRYGNVTHLWERECSIQRRFQKVIELAPSTIKDRPIIRDVIQSAVRLAKSIRYVSLGTFEFLVHESSREFYFLEVNPRLQVEHTITEEISGVDIVRSQLLLAQGARLDDLGLPSKGIDGTTLPEGAAIQLRLTAENAKKGFTLSMGKITQVRLPVGHGVRVDTHLQGLAKTQIGSSYDSLLAKVIVKAKTFEAARVKALRALSDVAIKGIDTNLPALLGVLGSDDFTHLRCSTLWLETNLASVLETGMALFERNSELWKRRFDPSQDEAETSAASIGAAKVLFRKGDGFTISLEEKNAKPSRKEEILLTLDRVRINDFPTSFSGEVTLQSSTSGVKSYVASVGTTTQTSVASGSHRMGDVNDPSHVCLPFSGEFVELSVDEGDLVDENGLLCVVKQMKMELEVRAPYAGRVTWVCEAQEGEQVNEGLLVCILSPVEERLEPRRPKHSCRI